MANWTGVITNAGNVVLNEWVNEKALTMDRAAAGQGTVSAAGLLAQTALVSQRQEAHLLGGEKDSNGIRLKLRFPAADNAYTLNQIGVWASVTGGESTMIALFQHEQGIPIPSQAESPDFLYTFYGLISCSNTGEWNITVDTSVAATVGDLEQAKTDSVAEALEQITTSPEAEELTDSDAFATVTATGIKRTPLPLLKQGLGKLFTPAPLDKDLTLYVSTTGNDSNDGLSAETAKRTIQAAINAVPTNLGGYMATINIADGDYAEDVQVFPKSNGTIRLTGNTVNKSAVSVTGVQVRGCAGRVIIEYLSLTYAITYDTLLCLVQFCDIDSPGVFASNIGIGCQNSNLSIYSVSFQNCSTCVGVGAAGRMSAGSCTGSRNEIGISISTGDGYPAFAMTNNCNWGAETEIQNGYNSIIFKNGVQV